MKRLSSYGFTPVSVSEASSCSEQSTAGQQKRPRTTESVSEGRPPVNPDSEPAQTSGSHSGTILVRGDIGTYSTDDILKLTDDEKYWLLKNAFRPQGRYKFPSQEEYGKNRSFQHSWLNQYPWLTYSESRNGGYCVNCVLFAKRIQFGSLGRLITYPLTNFTRAVTTLSKHSSQPLHEAAMIDSMTFMSLIEKGHLSISQLVEKEASTIYFSSNTE